MVFRRSFDFLFGRLYVAVMAVRRQTLFTGSSQATVHIGRPIPVGKGSGMLNHLRFALLFGEDGAHIPHIPHIPLGHKLGPMNINWGP